LEKLEDPVAIVGSGYKVWDLATMSSELLEANWLQSKIGKRGFLHFHISLKEHQQPNFIFPSCK
jgi:hypothetical protein